jgi:hypothetical protein
MVLLCSRHHQLHHDGHYRVALHDGLPRFSTTDGRSIGVPDPCATLGSTFDPPPTPPLRSGEPLTTYGLDVLLHHLLTSG